MRCRGGVPVGNVQAMSRAPALVLSSVLLATPAWAHDNWISRGGLRNAAGEWCCGAGDCALLDREAVTETAGGYRLSGGGTIFGSADTGNIRIQIDETVPFSEVMPSPDGAFWRCHRPDRSRRCMFGPPPGS